MHASMSRTHFTILEAKTFWGSLVNFMMRRPGISVGIKHSALFTQRWINAQAPELTSGQSDPFSFRPVHRNHGVLGALFGSSQPDLCMP